MSASTTTCMPGETLSNSTTLTYTNADEAQVKEYHDATELQPSDGNLTRFFFKDLCPVKPCSALSLGSEALLEKIGLVTLEKDGKPYYLGTGLIIANNRLRPASDFPNVGVFAEYTMCYIRLSIRQLLRGMVATLQEYFSWKIMRHYIEVPAFKHLEQAIDQFQVNLLAFQRDFKCSFNLAEEEVDYMVYRIRSYVMPFLAEGWTVLDRWTYREDDQPAGESLTGRDWRTRRLAVQASNERLVRLNELILWANRLLLQEHAAKGRGEERIPKASPLVKLTRGDMRRQRFERQIRKVFPDKSTILRAL